VGALLVVGLFLPLQPPNARDVDIPGSAEFQTVYFPGDAPVAEVLLIFSVVLALVCLLSGMGALVACKVFRLRAAFRRISMAPLLLAALPMCLVLYSGGSILGRRFGEWRDLHALLTDYSRRVSALTPDKSRLLTEAEYRAIDATLLTPRPTFSSRGFEKPVQIRMMQTYPPFVGVDFGKGRNAVFDLLTMSCTYSD
jgi:hypothetical protein